MDIKSSEKYRYYQISENVIMFIKNNSIGQEIYDIVEKIVDNTANTWQKDRTKEEIYHDTLQGKLAEDMFADFIQFYQKEQTILYLSYDDFREDGFEKHAPIDGILYLCGNECVFCKRKFLSFAKYFPHPTGGEFQPMQVPMFIQFIDLTRNA